MYKAIVRFKDTDGKIYEIGDTYEGKAKRIKQLSTDDNKVGYPVIEKVEEQTENIVENEE